MRSTIICETSFIFLLFLISLAYCDDGFLTFNAPVISPHGDIKETELAKEFSALKLFYYHNEIYPARTTWLPTGAVPVYVKRLESDKRIKAGLKKQYSEK